MFGIGGTELVIILIFGFLLFGPDKLPQMGRTIGRAIRQFRSAQEQMNKVVRAEVYDPLSDSEPLKDLSALFTGGSTTSSSGSSSESADQKGQAASATPAQPRINPVKPLAVKGETFAQKKARLAREKAERDLAQATARVAASKEQSTSDAQRSSDAHDTSASVPTSPGDSTDVKGGQGA